VALIILETSDNLQQYIHNVKAVNEINPWKKDIALFILMLPIFFRICYEYAMLVAFILIGFFLLIYSIIDRDMAINYASVLEDSIPLLKWLMNKLRPYKSEIPTTPENIANINITQCLVCFANY
jgi:hypothetical protein